MAWTGTVPAAWIGMVPSLPWSAGCRDGTHGPGQDRLDVAGAMVELVVQV